MPSFDVVTGNVVADFEFGLSQLGKAAVVEQPCVETASKRFGGGVSSLPRRLLLCWAPGGAIEFLERVMVY